MSDTTISTQAYNGWSNRETWLGNLWLTGDEGLYGLLVRAIRENNTVQETAQYIEQELTEQLEGEVATSSLWRDLLGWAFDQIDWEEIVTKNIE